MVMEEQNKSKDILYNSATLLGLCFIVLTSVKMRNQAETSLIDEMTAISIILFMISSVLSYLSMRKEGQRSKRFERIADVVFLIGLFFLFLTTILLITGMIA